MKRIPWNTNFREDLRQEVNILAAKLDVKPNHVLEIGFEYLKGKVDADASAHEEINLILEKYKEEK